MRSLPFSLSAVVIVVSGTPSAAQDAVPNPSFENLDACPTTLSEIELAPPWIAATIGTPDIFNSCHGGMLMGVPTNALGFQAAYSGDGYAGFLALFGHPDFLDYREYLQTSFVGGTLEAGETYRFQMHLSLAEDSSAATDRIGAYLSSTAIGSGSYMPLPVTPQFETPAGTFLDDTVDWMSFEEVFVADGTEQYLTVGNFHDYASSAQIPAGFGPTKDLFFDESAYYYIDVISLQCEPCLDAPPDLVGWWPLDEDAGPLTADIAGANDGVHEDSPVPVEGWVDLALEFAASGVSVPSAPELELGTGDFSIDAWVRPEGSTQQALVAKIPLVEPVPTGAGYALAVNADLTLTFTMVDAALSEVSFTTAAALPTSEWSLVTVTVDRDDPTGGRVWIGETFESFDPTPAAGSLANALPLRFGRDGGADVGDDFTGALDEVELFDRALETSEVEGIHGVYTSGKCKTVLEIAEVTVVDALTGPSFVVLGEIVSAAPTAGTYTVSARGEPVNTLVGNRASNVPGPANVFVLTPQPIQVAPEGRAEVRFELDAPRGLAPGQRAAWAVDVTHVETGRQFTTQGLIIGHRQRAPLRR